MSPCWSIVRVFRCPTHPAVFASVDGAGTLDVWNINHDTEVPLYTRTITRYLYRGVCYFGSLKIRRCKIVLSNSQYISRLNCYFIIFLRKSIEESSLAPTPAAPGCNPSLSRCRWSRNGKLLAVGDAEGRLHLFDVAAEVS